LNFGDGTIAENGNYSRQCGQGLTEAALLRWMATLRRWKRNTVDRNSPLVATIRRPVVSVAYMSYFTAQLAIQADRLQINLLLYRFYSASA